MDIDDYDVAVLVITCNKRTTLGGMPVMGEAMHVWEQGYMGNLCTPSQLFL